MSKLPILEQSHSKLFLLLCFIPVSAFSYIHFLRENYLLAFALVFTAFIFAFNFKNIKNNHLSKRCKASIIISMWCCLALASYSMGIYGIFYTFPSIVGLFYLASVRTALYISIPSVFIFLFLTTLYGEPPETLKLVTSFLLTIAFSAYSAYFIRRQQDALDIEAQKDPLTSLANRHAYNEWLHECEKNRAINLITSINLDIDNFRFVNDRLGFDTGDKLIKQIAKKLTNIIENDSTISCAHSIYLARFSGDAFAIGLTNLPNGFNILPFVQNLQLAVGELIVVPEHHSKISASVAIVNTERTNGVFSNIIDNVDVTLKQVKRHGGNSVKVFDESVGALVKQQKYIAEQLSQAIINDQFHMVFMPIFRNDNKTIAGAELLLRCDRKELSKYGPDKFIPIAENYGLILQIDFWVLNESFKIITNNVMLRLPSVEFYSINISSHQLHNKEFIPCIQKIIKKFDIDPNIIELEITETSLIDTDLQAIETLISLRRIGFKLSLDDFGTGFTSFNQLKKYPLNCLKIDRSFVSGDMENTTPHIGMSLVILSIAKLYNYSVIAEGVETEKQYLELKDNGCLYFQGYWFSKPISLKEFVSLLVDISH
jgi:diguanylate cyclase (GGDEF)-like protein